MTIFDDIVNGVAYGWYVDSYYRIKKLYPLIKCFDGTTLSVQASVNHYSIPPNNKGPYTNVGVGYPSVCPPDTWD